MNREQRERHEKGEKRPYKPSCVSRASRLKIYKGHSLFFGLQRTLPFRRRGEGYARRINWSIPFLTLGLVEPGFGYPRGIRRRGSSPSGRFKTSTTAPASKAATQQLPRPRAVAAKTAWSATTATSHRRYEVPSHLNHPSLFKPVKTSTTGASANQEAP